MINIVYIDNDVVECVRPERKYNGNIANSASTRECISWEHLILQNDIVIQNDGQPMFHPLIDGIHNFPDMSYANLGNKCRHVLIRQNDI